MKVNRLSIHTVRNGLFNNGLNAELYSKFKYGSRPVAFAYADQLRALFLEKFGVDYILRHKVQIIISTSPFWYTPPPANTIALRFLYHLNSLLVEYEQMPLRYVKIHRGSAPRVDFSALTSEERESNMKQDLISVDPEAFRGKKVVLIEDARITGAHEAKTIKYLQGVGVDELTFLYVVDVADGATDPHIEFRLNHAWMNDLDKLATLMENEADYVLNARVCRYILSYPDKAKIEWLARSMPYETLASLDKYSVSDGYGVVAKYREGFKVIRMVLRERQACADNT